MKLSHLLLDLMPLVSLAVAMSTAEEGRTHPPVGTYGYTPEPTNNVTLSERDIEGISKRAAWYVRFCTDIYMDGECQSFLAREGICRKC